MADGNSENKHEPPAKRPAEIPKPDIFENLPDALLTRVLTHVNVWHLRNIRFTSCRMRDVTDDFILQSFKKAYYGHLRRNIKNYESFVLTTIHNATSIYVSAAFDKIFAGCILPMLRASYKEPFSPQVQQITHFLEHFYNVIEKELGPDRSQYSRLLFNLTLMRILRSFPTYSLVTSSEMPLQWRLGVLIKGSWFGILWSPARTQDFHTKRSNLLVMLSEMLISNLTDHVFKRVWETSTEVYVFGNDITKSNRSPKTHFTFTISGSQKICQLFRDAIIAGPSYKFDPSIWPSDQFSVTIDVACREAMKWGCSRSQHMEFGPYDESGGERSTIRVSESFNADNVAGEADSD